MCLTEEYLHSTGLLQYISNVQYLIISFNENIIFVFEVHLEQLYPSLNDFSCVSYFTVRWKNNSFMSPYVDI